jgi:hypothetical protein
MEGDTPCACVGMRAFADQQGEWIMVHVGGMCEIADRPGFPASASADERALVRAFAGIVRQYHALQAGQATIGRAALLARVTPDERRLIEAAQLLEPPRRSRARRGALGRLQERVADARRRSDRETMPRDDPPLR